VLPIPPARGGARDLGATAVFAEALAALAVTAYLWQWGGVSLESALLLPAPALLAGVLVVRERRRGIPSPSLLPLGLALNLLGLTVLAVIAPYFYRLQAAWSCLAVAVYALSSWRRLPRGWPIAYSFRLYAFSLVLVLLTFIVGTNPSGAGPKQWLALGAFYFQPSELLKLGLILMLGKQLGEGPGEQADRHLWLPAAAAGGLLLVAQGDLGATLVFTGIAALVYYSGSGRWRPLVGGVFILALLGVLAYAFVPHVRARFGSWLNPWRDPLGSSYQVLQGLRAIAEGGVFGKGLATPDSVHVPASHTDLIVSAVGERLGLAGSLGVLAAFALLLWRLGELGSRAQSEPWALVCLGVAALLVGQGALIVGGATALLPLTGVTLPFVSYGGSSLLVSYLALGLLEGTAITTAGSPRRAGNRRAIYLALAASLLLLALWLSAWHLFGTSILAGRLAGA